MSAEWITAAFLILGPAAVAFSLFESWRHGRRGHRLPRPYSAPVDAPGIPPEPGASASSLEAS